ncbi:hypothetical protein [Propionivibrio sp.]|uniref:hypothetical protein n=1 Tax=Propionivibrio sp. TaxID=2212460 RepID=UPI003BEF7323
MRLNFDMSLIERMSEGVVLLDKNGGIKAFNSAARSWLPECAGLVNPIREMIKRSLNGLLALPAALQLNGVWDKDLPSPADAWLCQDGRYDYAIFIARPSPEQEFKSSETRFVALLGEQARKEMDSLKELLRAVANSADIDRTAILQQSARVDRVLVEIEQLSTLFQHDKVFLEDRLSPIALLKEVLPGLPGQRGENAINYKLIETRDQLGVLYGDAAWLKYAFHNLLAVLGESAPPQSRVVLELRQLGDFIVFTGRVRSAPGLSVSRAKVRDQDNASPMERDIRMQMCRRIIELHGGRLKVSVTTNDGPDEYSTGYDAFTINLLTGLPSNDRSLASCAECRFTLQAQAYAQDLSALLAERS